MRGEQTWDVRQGQGQVQGQGQGQEQGAQGGRGSRTRREFAIVRRAKNPVPGGIDSVVTHSSCVLKPLQDAVVPYPLHAGSFHCPVTTLGTSPTRHHKLGSQFTKLRRVVLLCRALPDSRGTRLRLITREYPSPACCLFRDRGGIQLYIPCVWWSPRP